MTNVYKIDNLQQILECAICLDRYRTPKVLACQHTFCLACLQGAYNTRNRTMTCPTCRKVMNLSAGPSELPNNVLLINLMDVQPVKAKCPCCDKVETLTICEHCHCTKCTNCNEKHIDDIRKSAQTTLTVLTSTDQKDLKASIHDAFKGIRNEIQNKFQTIRQQQDSILLTKQMEIVKQLDSHEQTLLTHVAEDFQPLEQLKVALTGKTYHFESKNEPELIDLLQKASDIQTRLAAKLVEHHNYLNSVEISLQYDPDCLDQINQMCNRIQLSVIDTKTQKSNQQSPRFSAPSESIYITLRTFLNQEYKCRASLNSTVSELKQIFGKQENLEPNRITLTKTGNFFDELDDSRTLRSYDCDSTTVLMICIRK